MYMTGLGSDVKSKEGFSRSPWLDYEGRLVGISASIVSDQGQRCAIAINTKHLQQLLEKYDKSQ